MLVVILLNINLINRICRMDIYGNSDSTFNIGTGFNGGVYAINMDTINQKNIYWWKFFNI